MPPSLVGEGGLRYDHEDHGIKLERGGRPEELGVALTRLSTLGEGVCVVPPVRRLVIPLSYIKQV